MKSLVAAFALMLGLSMEAQENLSFRHLNREDGLSNSSVESIFQDSRGFLWVGTQDGLNRYDGYNFTVFQMEYPKRKISNNFITHITEDSKKRLWVATANGVCLYNSKLDIFEEKHHPHSNIINLVYETHDGKILAGTASGLNIYDEKSGKFQSFNTNEILRSGIQDEIIIAITRDIRGNYWVGTNGNGIFIFSADFKYLKRINPKSKISALATDSTGNVWIGYHGNGIDLVDGTNVRHFSYTEGSHTTLLSNIVKCIYIDRNNNAWVGTENGGLSIYNRSRGDFRNYQNEINTPSSIAQKTVSAILQDRQKNVWIGTHRGGLSIFSPHENQFRYFTHGNTNKSLSFKDTKCFLEASNGMVYVGTDGGGLNVWNRNTGSFQHFMHQNNKKDCISSNAVLSLAEDNDGSVWVGTWEGGLNRFDPSTGIFTKFTHNPSDPHSLSSNNVWEIFNPGDGTIWLGTSIGGISIYEKKTGKFSRFGYSKSQKSKLYGEHVTDIIRDATGSFWIATHDGGLNKYHIEKDVFEHFFVEKSSSGFTSTVVECLLIDNSGTLWAATGRGLYRYDSPGNCFIRFNIEGFKNLSIKSMETDNDGFLWCGTGDGLVKIDPGTGSAQRYTDADGLQGLDFAKKSSLRLRSGDLLFGGYNGFNSFNPALIDVNRTPPNVYVINLEVMNETIRPDTAKNAIMQARLFDQGAIVLKHQQSRLITFEFAALNFIATSKNQYAYKLEGYDNNWNYIGTQRHITFTNLDPGTYFLKVKAANNDGVWNHAGATIKIDIHPPFWLTWWFSLLLAMACLAIVLIYFKMYQNLVARKIHEKKQEELHNQQLDFFTHISHELRTPLSLILGVTEKLEGNNEQRPLSKSYFKQLYRHIDNMVDLIKEIMDFRKVESGIITLKVAQHPFEKIVHQIAVDFIPFAKNKNITYSINTKYDMPAAWCDKQFIERITMNLLSNSFKYTASGGAISINVLPNLDDFNPAFNQKIIYKSNFKTEQYLYIHIRDNGVGIEPEALRLIFEKFYRAPNTAMGSGIGLAFVKSLVMLHKGVIYVYSQKNAGTEILIGVPYRIKDYNNTELLKKTPDSKATFELTSSTNNFSGNEKMISDWEDSENDLPPSHHTLLLVEDNEEIRGFLKSVLSKKYRIIEAGDGQEGLKKAVEAIPDLIITDVMMPVMDGIEMCALIKQNEAINHIPIIMLTARDSDESKILGTETGADYYFAKPLSIKVLTATVNNLFKRSAKLKSRFLKDYQQEIRDNIHSSKEREVIDALLLILDNHMDEPELNIEFICRSLGMSKTKLFTIVKSATGKALTEFIRSTKLKKAVYIMTHEDVSITDVMNRVGIQSASYFTKAFKNEWGVTPSEYYKKLKTRTIEKGMGNL